MIIKETINVYRCNVCSWETTSLDAASKYLLAYNLAPHEDDESAAGVVHAGIIDKAPIHICHWCVAAIKNDKRLK